jgi:type II secretory pathway component PulF
VAYFRYSTVDTRGRTVTGQIEAGGLDDAREKLAEMGIPPEQTTVEEVAAESGGMLSGREAAELSGQIAGVAASGLPLGTGLRALAEEIPRPHLRAVLGRLADRIDAGESLDAALASEGDRVPEHVRCLLAASVASGHFTEVLQQLVSLERDRLTTRMRLRVVLAYPLILLAITVLLFAAFSDYLVPQFLTIFKDFNAELPALTVVMIKICSPAGAAIALSLCGLLALGILAAFGLRSRVAWVQRALYLAPLVGPCWRMRGLADFSRLMALLLELKVPLPQALRAAASSLREADLQVACRSAAELVEAGVPFSDALARLGTFPPTFGPPIRYGERAADLAGALRGTAEVFEGRLSFQDLFLGAVALPAVLGIVGVMFGLMVIGMFLPLISLIQKLS